MAKDSPTRGRLYFYHLKQFGVTFKTFKKILRNVPQKIPGLKINPPTQEEDAAAYISLNYGNVQYKKTMCTMLCGAEAVLHV